MTLPSFPAGATSTFCLPSRTRHHLHRNVNDPERKGEGGIENRRRIPSGRAGEGDLEKGEGKRG